MTGSNALVAFRQRASLGLILMAVGAPAGALAINLGAPEMIVYYLAFGLAGLLTIAGLTRAQPKTDLGQPVTTALLVEDQEELRRRLTKLLAARGVKVHAVASDREALAAVRHAQNHFDIVLFDIASQIVAAGLVAFLRRERPHQAVVVVQAAIDNERPAAPPEFRIVEASPSNRTQVEELLSVRA